MRNEGYYQGMIVLSEAALPEPTMTPGWDGTPIPSRSYGPAWDAAVAAGFDMTLIEHSLTLTYAERAQRLQDFLNFSFELRQAKATFDAVAAKR